MSARRRTAWLGALALGGLSIVALARPGAAPSPGTEAGPRVVDLRVTAGRSNVLTWDGDAVSYRIERSERASGPWSAVATVSSTRFADRPHDHGIYWYRISALRPGEPVGAATPPVSSDHVSMTGRVGPRGGVLRPTTGTIRLEIPPGAVDRPTTFSIDQLASPPRPHADGLVVTRAFEIGPTGTTFDPPAILTLRADAPGENAIPPDADVTTRSWNATAQRWDELGTPRFDPKRSTVTARIPHLSLWAAAAVTVPHGGYGIDTDFCGTCHDSHDSQASPGLSAPTERETCYACHDGSGAASDVRGDFGEVVLGSSTRTSVHPVPAPAAGVELTCSDCHTPHKPIAEDTVLLRVLQSDGSYLYSPPDAPIGDAFCYACHGAASSLPAPFGDHSAFEIAAHGTDPSVPLPTSGSGIRCLACHEPHGSDNARLTTADQESLCYTCHTQADPPSPLGTTVAGAFAARDNDYATDDGNPVRLYHHPIGALEQDAGARVVECSSCHNVHLAQSADSATGGQLVDPADTTSPWIVTWDDTAAPQTKGDIGTFCLRCHVDPTTTSPIAPGPNVPYTVRLTDDTGLDADGTQHDTFTAADWLNVSPHGPTLGALACTACHDVHGSSNAYLLREAMVSPDGTTQNLVTGFNALGGDTATLTTFCQTCHASLPADEPHTNGTLCTECHSHGSGRF